MSDYCYSQMSNFSATVYHGEYKLHSMRWWYLLSGTLYQTNKLSWIFIVLAHWNNSLWVEVSLLSDTLFWFRANQSLLFLLAEKQQLLNTLNPRSSFLIWTPTPCYNLKESLKQLMNQCFYPKSDTCKCNYWALSRETFPLTTCMPVWLWYLSGMYNKLWYTLGVSMTKIIIFVSLFIE